MHHIQQKILQTLLYAEALRYASLRPKGIESNLFAYHLEQLMRAGLVRKKERQYSLSPAGLMTVDRLSREKMPDRLQPHPQPHIVTATNLTVDDGRMLVFRRGFQPYINRYGFVLGKIHYEETMQQAAQRELQEKADIVDLPLTHRGLVYLESKINGTVISRVMYHLFSGHVAQPQPLAAANKRGECMWLYPDDLQPHQTMPGFLTMQQLLAANEQFFYAELSEEQAELPAAT